MISVWSWCFPVLVRQQQLAIRMTNTHDVYGDCWAGCVVAHSGIDNLAIRLVQKATAFTPPSTEGRCVAWWCGDRTSPNPHPGTIRLASFEYLAGGMVPF